MSNSTLKTVRFNSDTLEALSSIAKEEDIAIDELIDRALREWLEARVEAKLKEELLKNSLETKLDFNEFWDGVDLD